MNIKDSQTSMLLPNTINNQVSTFNLQGQALCMSPIQSFNDRDASTLLEFIVEEVAKNDIRDQRFDMQSEMHVHDFEMVKDSSETETNYCYANELINVLNQKQQCVRDIVPSNNLKDSKFNIFWSMPSIV